MALVNVLFFLLRIATVDFVCSLYISSELEALIEVPLATLGAVLDIQYTYILKDERWINKV